MRIISILTALLVAAVLYAVVLERDRLLDWARAIAPAASGEAPAPEVAAAPEAGAPVADSGEDEGETSVAVMAMRSVARMIDDAVVLRGETQASREVDVMAETAGRVSSAPLPKGTRVTEGQVLCKLEPGTSGASLDEAVARLAEARAQRPQVEARIPEAEAMVLQAEAQLEEARINLTAAEQLSRGGYASRTKLASSQAQQRAAEAGVISAEAGLKSARSGVDSLEASIESARASVARAQTVVDNLTITAPFAGLLESDTAELGSLMAVGGHCATVIQLDPLKIVGFVPEVDVARVETGARAGARLTGDVTVTGTVTFVSRQSDPTTRTFRVEITLPNPDRAIRAGQTADIGIEAEGAMAHLLPQSALTLDDEGRIGIRSATPEGRAAFLPVRILRDTREGIWVGGLPDEVDVITVGQEYVTDGVAVSPSFEEVIQ
ncbi:efflux RND transporter periplasmic adaptor subunit [Salipiger sp.]|uniref:efflux RND transporter periplasmic adaptor subunit n=1 Tax=Salipiger sp. TaxID=2078585 RepID=UPI003A983B53